MVHVPNPVDTDHFKPDGALGDKAFTIRTTRGDAQWVLDYIKKNGIDLDVEVIDREGSPIPYVQVPSVLRQYGTYVDIKYIDGMLLAAPSKTGLESLACGLAVLNHELQFVKGLPEEHKPKVVAQKVMAAYA